MPLAPAESFESIHAIDTVEMGCRNRTASYVIHDEKTAVVDPGLSTGAPRVLDGLEALDISPSQVEYVLLTHIHTDHAGGASAVLDECPNAEVVVHELGADFIAVPEKVETLVESVHRAVGMLADRYGTMEPIDPDRITTVDGGESIVLSGRQLEVVYAPGHAPHQVAYHDPASSSIFVADECGEYLQGDVLPTTPPPNFDLDANLESLDAFRDLDPERLFYPHFGKADRARSVIDTYETVIQEWVQTVDEARRECDDEDDIIASLSDHKQPYVERYDEMIATEILRMDVEGTLRYLESNDSA
jgi:glyoxylase-like metal-dependent hydrolase (beta-lactamase superfamily II)